VCATGCAQLEGCGIPNPQCAKECPHRAEVQQCFERATHDCQIAAECTFLITCHAAPGGLATCLSVQTAQGRCNLADDSCRCIGVRQLAPARAFTLALFDHCAVACGGDPLCIQKDQECLLKRQTCWAQ